MVKWERMSDCFEVTAQTSKDPSLFDKWVNDYIKDGWQKVSVRTIESPYFKASAVLFKRPIPAD